MKAVALEGYGLENVVVADVADVHPAPGEVTVAVGAAGLNRLDLWTMSGALKVEHHFPHVLGADATGEIAEVGDGVRGMRPGLRVILNPALSCGACEFCRSGEQSLCTTFRMLGEHVPGTFAELVKVPASNVFPVPDHLSTAEAAALGVTFFTAYRMAFVRGRMRPGEWILITGIGGGLAQSLLQLVRPVAGRVFVTSSSDDKIRRAIELGADDGVNYNDQDVGRAIRGLTAKRGVDAVFDSAGGTALDPSLRALRKGGRLIVAGATAGGRGEIDVRRLFWNQLEVIGSTMGSNAEVSDLLRMVSGTRLRPLVDRTFPLADGRDALARLEQGNHFGKLVLEVA